MKPDKRMEKKMINLIRNSREWFEYTASKLGIVLVCASVDFCALFKTIDFAVEAQNPIITGLICFGYSLLLCIPPVILAKQVHNYKKLTGGAADKDTKSSKLELGFIIFLVAGEVMGLFMQYYLRVNADTASAYNAMAQTTVQESGADPGELFMSWIPCFSAIVNFFIVYVTTGEAAEAEYRLISKLKLKLLAIENKVRIVSLGTTEEYKDNLIVRESACSEAERDKIASHALMREAQSQMELAKKMHLEGDDIDHLVKDFNKGVNRHD